MRHGTYSLVARDAATGELGAAVQSHWFSVGSLCIWGRPGVGRSRRSRSSSPPRVRERSIFSRPASRPPRALTGLLAADELARYRQVGIDARGDVAVHTGPDCIARAGQLRGEAFSYQANLMARDTVPEAMAADFRVAEGDLVDRLVAALHGAEARGDVRGRQSAALLIVPGWGEPWDTTVDLRVEDHPDPLAELEWATVAPRTRSPPRPTSSWVRAAPTRPASATNHVGLGVAAFPAARC